MNFRQRVRLGPAGATHIRVADSPASHVVFACFGPRVEKGGRLEPVRWTNAREEADWFAERLTDLDREGDSWVHRARRIFSATRVLPLVPARLAGFPHNAPAAEELMREQETAQMLGVEPGELRALRLDGTGPASEQVGPRSFSYRYGIVEEWIASYPQGEIIF